MTIRMMPAQLAAVSAIALLSAAPAMAQISETGAEVDPDALGQACTAIQAETGLCVEDEVIVQGDADPAAEESGADMAETDGDEAAAEADADGAAEDAEDAADGDAMAEDGEADMAATDADPLEDAAEGDAAGAGDLLTYQTDEMGNFADDASRDAYVEAMASHSLIDMSMNDLVGLNVLDETGEDVGEIDHVGIRGNTIVTIVGVGGFLGIGEHDVAMPLDRLSLDADNAVVLNGVTREEIEGMAEYDEDEVRLIEDGGMTVRQVTEGGL